MTLYGAAASSVIWWEGDNRWLGGAVWALVALALGIAGIMQLLSVRSLTGAPAGARKFDRVLARRVGTVIGIYTVAEAISALALHAMGFDPLIFPIAVAVAGVHFWAFAWVLGVRQYIVTGILDSLFVAITLVVTRPTSMVGSMSAWVFYPLLGGGVSLLVTAGLMLYESGRILRRLGNSQMQARPE